MDDSERGGGGRTAGRFELRRHTADVAVEAIGDSLGEAFAAAGAGFTAAHCEAVPVTGERFGFGVGADSREALLFDYLDELIYQRDVRSVLPVDNDATVDAPADSNDGDVGWHLEGSARGIPLAAVHARDIKAVTYSEMAVEETDDGWRCYVVLDV